LPTTASTIDCASDSTVRDGEMQPRSRTSFLSSFLSWDEAAIGT
jgi:hypothetical protein